MNVELAFAPTSELRRSALHKVDRTFISNAHVRCLQQSSLPPSYQPSVKPSTIVLVINDWRSAVQPELDIDLRDTDETFQFRAKIRLSGNPHCRSRTNRQDGVPPVHGCSQQSRAPSNLPFAIAEQHLTIDVSVQKTHWNCSCSRLQAKSRSERRPALQTFLLTFVASWGRFVAPHDR